MTGVQTCALPIWAEPGALLRGCHEALRVSRGAAVSLASIDGRNNTMAWLGVGNVDGLLVCYSCDPPKREMLITRGGVVGFQLPPLRTASLPVCRGDLCGAGDARLTKRLVRLADDLSSNPAKSIPVACCSETGGRVEDVHSQPATRGFFEFGEPGLGCGLLCSLGRGCLGRECPGKGKRGEKKSPAIYRRGQILVKIGITPSRSQGPAPPLPAAMKTYLARQ